MRRLRSWRNRLRSIISRQRADDGLANELAFHLDQLVAENIASGLPSRQAREAALRTFGNVPLWAEQCRDQRRVGWLHDLRRDIAYGLRLLRSNLRFTLVAVGSLALGIGANTAILGTLGALFRGTMIMPDASRLMLLRGYPSQLPTRVNNATAPEYLAWKERLHSFTALGMSIANRQDFVDAADGLPPERLTGQAFTPSLFTILAVPPILGRTFSADEGRLESPARVIVLSYRLWQRRFGGDRAILNRQLQMDGDTWTVIGVMPPGFWYPHEDCEYWIPLRLLPQHMQGSERLFAVTARLKDGVSQQQAQAELDSVSTELAREFPARQRDWRARVVPLREFWFAWLRLPLAILEAACAMVLLIACTNVGALQLARATARRAEFAMRIALGASRARLLRQLLAESLLLSSIGGICSLAVAWGCLRMLAIMQPTPGGVHVQHLALGLPAMTITVLLSCLSGLAAGAAPVLWGLGRDASFRETSERGGTLGGAMRGALVAVQLSLALMLLIASGLLIKNLYRVASGDRGFNVDGLLTFDFRIPPGQFLQPAGSYYGIPIGEAHATTAVVKRVYERLRTIPGVELVAGVSSPPVNALVVPQMTILREGTSAPVTPAERDSLGAVHLRMTPGYLRVVRAALVRGRDISDADTAPSPWVAVINETMARRFWPGEDPIGKRFMFDVVSGEQPRIVVGVVHDMMQFLGGFAIRPTVYTSYQQQPEHYRGPYANQYGQMTFVLRGAGDPGDLMPAVRRAVAEVEPDRTISNMTRLVWWGGFGTINRGVYSTVVLSFAIVATLLASIGVYGLTAYALSQRTHEIGIRLALGAPASEIRRLLWRQGIWLIGAGVVVGGTGALALMRLLSFDLEQVSPRDPVIFSGAIVLLALAALASSFAPARAARRINPAIALRCE